MRAERSRKFWGAYSPASRSIAVEPTGAHAELTSAHEFGHFIDYELQRFPGRMTDSGDPAIRAWSKVVHASAAIQRLDAMSATVDRDYVLYLLREREIWARSYAQWIAVRSANSKMLSGVAEIRKVDFSPSANSQWADDDFAPIAEAFDKFFRSKGLME